MAAGCLMNSTFHLKLENSFSSSLFLAGGKKISENVSAPVVFQHKKICFPVVSAAKHHLKALPFKDDALSPHLSAASISQHYGLHYSEHLNELNAQLASSDALSWLSLEDLVHQAYNHGNPLPHFHNAAQVWNHEFFWESMKAGGGGRPNQKFEISRLISRDFGSLEHFLYEFKKAAMSNFGSGWTWLSVEVENAYPAPYYRAPDVLAGKVDERIKIGKLKVVNTKNAMNPIVLNQKPLIGLDLWEHAYYTDYFNDRNSYVDTFLESLLNWDAAERRLQETKPFVLLHKPPPRTDLEYEDVMSDAEWLQVHKVKKSTKAESPEAEQAVAEKMIGNMRKSRGRPRKNSS